MERGAAQATGDRPLLGRIGIERLVEITPQVCLHSDFYTSQLAPVGIKLTGEFHDLVNLRYVSHLSRYIVRA